MPYKDLDKRRATARAWRAAMSEKDREKVRERARAKYAVNPEKVRERVRARYAANPEKFRARARELYAANPEKKLEMNRTRYAMNPEKEREKQRERRAANPDKHRRRCKRVYQRARAKEAALDTLVLMAAAAELAKTLQPKTESKMTKKEACKAARARFYRERLNSRTWTCHVREPCALAFPAKDGWLADAQTSRRWQGENRILHACLLMGESRRSAECAVEDWLRDGGRWENCVPDEAGLCD